MGETFYLSLPIDTHTSTKSHTNAAAAKVLLF